MLQKSILFFVLLIFANSVFKAQEKPQPTPEPERTYYFPLTAQEIVSLEAKLKTTPNDADARRKLILYYNERETPAARKSLHQHRLALIENNPESSSSLSGIWFPDDFKKTEYAELKNAWLKKVSANPKNQEIRFQAASFFDYDTELREKIIQEGKIVDPGNPAYSVRLVEIYEIDFSPDYTVSDTEQYEKQVAFMKKVLGEAQNAATLAKKSEKTEETEAVYQKMLAVTARAAVEIGDTPTAKTAADQLLFVLGDPKMLTQSFLVSGIDNFQIANSVLGRIALRAGNVEKAKEHLMNSLLSISDENNGNPKIDSAFLEEMLVRNGSKNVIPYLELYMKSSSLNDEEKQFVKEKIAALNRGDYPNFESFSSLY